jgi:hypothetical protein
MREVFFHCSNADHFLVDRSGACVRDFSEACAHALRLVHAMMTTPNTEDWRGWELLVTDDLGEEILAVPFASVLGKLH